MTLYTRIHPGVTSTSRNCLQGMAEKQPSKLFSFRVPGDIEREIDEAVRRSGKDKTAWLLSTGLETLGKPDSYCSPETRLETLIGKMEGLLHGVADSDNKALSPPTAQRVGVNRKGSHYSDGRRVQTVWHPVQQ